MRLICSLMILFVLLPVSAQAQKPALEAVMVTEGVYALVGETGQRSPENLGNNATFGAIVTSKGVILIDSGGTARGAAAIHQAIQKITNKKIITVINTGGQDHRWLGNDYFRKLGATIISSAEAVADQKKRASEQFTALGFLVGEKGLAGTKDSHADQVFDKTLGLTIGGVELHLEHPGPAHTPGDIFVWLPGKKVMFSGDIVYLDRLLAVTDSSNLKGWIQAYERVASFKPRHLVPGHGRPATLEKARFQTYDYLINLRDRVQAYLDGGGDAQGSVNVDQSRFKDILNFDQLAKRNAQAAYIELEF